MENGCPQFRFHTKTVCIKIFLCVEVTFLTKFFSSFFSDCLKESIWPRQAVGNLKLVVSIVFYTHIPTPPPPYSCKCKVFTVIGQLIHFLVMLIHRIYLYTKTLLAYLTISKLYYISQPMHIFEIFFYPSAFVDKEV
jgi:hypothetical protein